MEKRLRQVTIDYEIRDFLGFSGNLFLLSFPFKSLIIRICPIFLLRWSVLPFWFYLVTEWLPVYITGQLLGGIIGGVVVWLHYLPHWKVTPDPVKKLAVFCTGPAIRKTWANLLSEIIGTFVLVQGILFIGANQFTEGLNPLIVGFLIVAIGVSMGGTTGYAINPARDLGPRIAHFLLPIAGKGKSDWNYSWIPVIGPAIGGISGALVYNLLKGAPPTVWFWPVMALVLAIVLLAVVNQLKTDKENE